MAFSLPIIPGVVEPITISLNRALVNPIKVFRTVRDHTRISPKSLREALRSIGQDDRTVLYAELSIYFIRQYTTLTNKDMAVLFGIDMKCLERIFELSPRYPEGDIKVMCDIDNCLKEGLIRTVAYNPKTKRELNYDEALAIRKQYNGMEKKHAFQSFFPSYIKEGEAQANPKSLLISILPPIFLKRNQG